MSKSQAKTASARSKHRRQKGIGPLAQTDRFKFRAVIHEAEEGGYWAEVPGFSGCVSEAETMEEMRANIREAFLGVLAVMQDRGALSGEPGLTEEILL